VTPAIADYLQLAIAAASMDDRRLTI
jgi:hypothetical protein